jgi:hypothetical protein
MVYLHKQDLGTGITYPKKAFRVKEFHLLHNFRADNRKTASLLTYRLQWHAVKSITRKTAVHLVLN